MIAFALSVLLGVATPSLPDDAMSGTATWYGNHTSQTNTYCFGGYKRTCSPYASGERVWYAAVGSWKWGDKPYNVRVCVKGTTRCVVVVVRDYCHGAWVALRKTWTSKSRVIDLSPAAFMQLAPLSRGVIQVEVSPIVAVERRGYR